MDRFRDAVDFHLRRERAERRLTARCSERAAIGPLLVLSLSWAGDEEGLQRSSTSHRGENIACRLVQRKKRVKNHIHVLRWRRWKEISIMSTRGVDIWSHDEQYLCPKRQTIHEEVLQEFIGYLRGFLTEVLNCSSKLIDIPIHYSLFLIFSPVHKCIIFPWHVVSLGLMMSLFDVMLPTAPSHTTRFMTFVIIRQRAIVITIIEENLVWSNNRT